MIRVGTAVLFALALTSAPAFADTNTTHNAGTDAPLSKKEAELRAESRAPMSASAKKRWHRKLAKRVGKPGERVINIFNGWTHENLVVPARGKGSSKMSQEVMNEFLRCRFTNKKTKMDGRLLPTAIKAARHFGSDRIVVVSAYRSPKYNLMLIKKGREVSRKSQHKHGRALDFRLDGVSAATLRDWAKKLRMGGVGFYRHSGFIHIDTAHVRYWDGR